MKTKKILLFSLILTLIFACSLAYFSVLALETYGPPVSPSPVPTDGYFEPAISMWWNEKNCGFYRPDFIIYKNGLRQPFDWSTEPDISPFGFEVIDDALGYQEGVSLTMTYTGTFQGGTSYMYTFLFDVYLTKPLGSEETLFVPETFYIDIIPYTEYWADAVLVDEDSKIYTFNNEIVTKTYQSNLIRFEVINAVENNYRVQINLFAQNPIDFYMIGIMVQNFYHRPYDPLLDGFYEAPNYAGVGELEQKENSLYEDVYDDIQYTKALVNPFTFNDSFISLSLKACKSCFEGVFGKIGTFDRLLTFSVGVGLSSFVLLIGSTIISNFKHRGE